MFLRPSVGNDSSQYGRVEGAVSGCRPAGPQNVGQVVSVCLACCKSMLLIQEIILNMQVWCQHGQNEVQPERAYSIDSYRK